MENPDSSESIFKTGRIALVTLASVIILGGKSNAEILFKKRRETQKSSGKPKLKSFNL